MILVPPLASALVAQVYESKLPISLIIHRKEHTGMIPVTAEYEVGYNDAFDQLLTDVARKLSKKQQTLLITPPLLSKEHPNEMETFTGFECSKCYGNGWIIALGERNETVINTCPICGGSGRLKAVVTTKWIPDKKEE